MTLNVQVQMRCRWACLISSVDIKYKPFTPQNSISGYELEGHELLCERLTWCGPKFMGQTCIFLFL